ncbi:MAG: Zn-ribbon domain-containing OB-fold protein [Promethearchaeota archaeon]
MNINEQIIWKKCKKCGTLQVSNHLRCIKCKNGGFDEIRAFGVPRLISFTLLTSPPLEFRDKGSYYLGIVEFENGIKLLGQITNAEDLFLGMKMNLKIKKICENLDGKEVKTIVCEPYKK